MSGSICVNGDKVTVDGKPRAPGWRKYWTEENVYGWHWIGPFRWDAWVDLIVLDFLPEDPKVRAEIEARFVDAKPPNGEPEFVP